MKILITSKFVHMYVDMCTYVFDSTLKSIIAIGIHIGIAIQCVSVFNSEIHLCAMNELYRANLQPRLRNC